MAKYIDVDKIPYFLSVGDDTPIEGIEIAYKHDINNQPTADVVEVVRCEKCKYFKEYSDAHKRAVERADGDCFFKEMYCYDKQFIACRYNDFCSYGERRDT